MPVWNPGLPTDQRRIAFAVAREIRFTALVTMHAWYAG
jgi:hypothetical protein